MTNSNQPEAGGTGGRGGAGDGPSSPASPAGPSKSAVFWRRFGSSVLLWGVVLGGLFSDHWLVSGGVFLILMTLLAGLGLAEFYDLARAKGRACFKAWGVFGGVLLMVSTFFYLSGWLRPTPAPELANDFETGFFILFVLGLCVRQFVSRAGGSAMEAVATTLFGLFYVPWLLNFIQKIHYYPGIGENGKYFVLYFVLVTKFSDMGAYSIGSLIGRHKMIPRISPGKTWEGFGGAVAVSVGASLLFVSWAGDRLNGMGAWDALALGLVLSVGAVIGDLVESLFKREAGCKDSGHWIPGIGGVLDLLDSLLFNAPLMYMYLRHVLAP